MTQHCKKCRKNQEPSEFVLKNRNYKTCNTCRRTRKRRRLTLNDCQEWALKKGGECLSENYKNKDHKMKWKCSEGHEWETSFGSIKNGGKWCPHCAGSARLTIEECQEFAITKGGECLSKIYKNNGTKMKWQCSEGHKWETSFGHIKNSKSWCPHCAGLAKLTIEECKEYARSKGGECLSKTYKNNDTKMNWKCSEGHEWKARFSDIKYGKWCPTCSGNKRLTIEECKEFAITKGGECLSKIYKNNGTKMKWICSEGHEWQARYCDVKNQNNWCPQCSSGKSEQACRKIFEDNLLEKFPNVRPDFLNGLELDGYNEELNIAFEYQGIQHYEYNKHFHRGDINIFHAQQERDRMKYKICKERGINLILIPYHVGTFNKPQDLETFIMDQLWMIC